MKIHKLAATHYYYLPQPPKPPDYNCTPLNFFITLQSDINIPENKRTHKLYLQTWQTLH